MTTKADFNAEEWERVAQAPALAGLLVILADRGGTIRETVALGRAYAEARRDAADELLGDIVATAPQVDPTSLRSEEHTSELQSRQYLVCRLLLEKKKKH